MHLLVSFLKNMWLEPISISEIEKAGDDDLVTLITIHSAKGAEQESVLCATCLTKPISLCACTGRF